MRRDPLLHHDTLSAEVMAASRRAGDDAAKLRRSARRHLELRQAYLATFFDDEGFLTPAGRLVLEDLIETSGFDTATHDYDPGALAAREGKRELVLHVFGQFRISEERLRRLEFELTKERGNDQ